MIEANRSLKVPRNNNRERKQNDFFQVSKILFKNERVGLKFVQAANAAGRGRPDLGSHESGAAHVEGRPRASDRTDAAVNSGSNGGDHLVLGFGLRSFFSLGGRGKEEGEAARPLTARQALAGWRAMSGDLGQGRKVCLRLHIFAASPNFFPFSGITRPSSTKSRPTARSPSRSRATATPALQHLAF